MPGTSYSVLGTRYGSLRLRLRTEVGHQLGTIIHYPTISSRTTIIQPSVLRNLDNSTLHQFAAANEEGSLEHG